MSLAREPIAFVDVETTGGHAGLHRITEIAIVGMDDGQIEWQWSTLVNPGTRIPPGIESLTGISQAMVAEAPSFEVLVPEILQRLRGRRFVAHNARFDYGFVRNEMRRCGVAYSSPVTCTVRLSRELFPQAPRHSLDAVIERHGLACSVRHRALPDAAAIAEFWQVILSETEEATLEAAIERVSRRPALPPQLSPDLVDDLPETPGVYRFWGHGANAEAVLLYIGKANNLRERVLSHFGTALRDGKSQRLAAQVRRVDWHETAGELGALLREARWVREHQPVYNRRLRGGGERWSWWLSDPSCAPTLIDLSGDWPAEGDLFGLYRSAREARKALESLAVEARLCRKLLGLESAGEGSCFGYQIGRCSGGCVQKESPVKHGLRVVMALSRQKLKRWPWSSAIAIEERNSAGLREYHVLDQWDYLGTVRLAQSWGLKARVDDGAGDRVDDGLDDGVDDGLDQLRNTSPRFDIETYRILSRLLSRGRLTIRPWPFGSMAFSAEDHG